jgi:hypothetical protein
MNLTASEVVVAAAVELAVSVVAVVAVAVAEEAEEAAEQEASPQLRSS